MPVSGFQEKAPYGEPADLAELLDAMNRWKARPRAERFHKSESPNARQEKPR
jgi:hypothetical protein